MLALSDASVNGIFAVAIAVIGGGVSVATVLLTRSAKHANAGIDELARDHSDCLDALDWVVGQLEKDRKVDQPLPRAVLRVRAQAARAAAQATRQETERQRARSAP